MNELCTFAIPKRFASNFELNTNYIASYHKKLIQKFRTKNSVENTINVDKFPPQN